MNLYLLKGTKKGYDTYDSCIVAAESEDLARNIHPLSLDGFSSEEAFEIDYYSWADKPSDIIVTCIGIANEEIESGVILASFNAG